MVQHLVRLPRSVALGAKSVAEFDVDVFEAASGKEDRNINKSQHYGRWDISYGIRSKQELLIVKNHCVNRFGPAYSFPFWDPADHHVGDFQTGDPQSIGTGDGSTTVFQIYQRQSDGTYYVDRDILLPVVNTFEVYVDGVVQSGGYTIDDETGELTFDVAPGNTLDIAVFGEFEKPARYVTNAFEISTDIPVDQHGTICGTIDSIIIKEVVDE